MKSAAITVSLNNFYYWYEDEALSKVLSWLLPIYSKKVDGFEISLSFEACEEWISKLKQGISCLPCGYSVLSPFAQRAILGCTANSIHLSDIKNLPLGKERWLASCLNEIFALTGISVFTTHPDEVASDRWSEIAADLHAGVTLSIENMCYRKKSHKTLSEIASILRTNPRISMTFDVNHWLELGLSLSSTELVEFVAEFHNRISKIHFSVPASSANAYNGCPATSHYAFADSEFDLSVFDMGLLVKQTNAPIVLEGLIPVHGIEALEGEILFATRLVDGLSSKKTLFGAF